ncbi:MAG: transposase [Candidatus Methanomethylicia archaeon]
MGFRELSDYEWGFIKPLLPPRPVRGRGLMVNDMEIINGIMYVVTTGCRWRDMPRRYGSYVTAGGC